MTFFAWVFVVEVETEKGEWAAIDQYDDVTQAVRHAEREKRNSRVRQFKVATHRPDPVATVKLAPNIPVPTVPFFCLTHQTNRAMALATSQPRCSECHKEMFSGTGLGEPP